MKNAKIKNKKILTNSKFQMKSGGFNPIQTRKITFRKHESFLQIIFFSFRSKTVVLA